MRSYDDKFLPFSASMFLGNETNHKLFWLIFEVLFQYIYIWQMKCIIRNLRVVVVMQSGNYSWIFTHLKQSLATLINRMHVFNQRLVYLLVNKRLFSNFETVIIRWCKNEIMFGNGNPKRPALEAMENVLTMCGQGLVAPKTKKE